MKFIRNTLLRVKLRPIAYLFVMGAILSACSGTQTKALLSGASNIAEVRYQLGLPLQGIIDLPNGNKMWTFSRSTTTYMLMNTPTSGTVYDAYGSATYNATTMTQVPVTLS